jgi:dTDP-glucose pyrophosphorylase
MAGKGSRFSNAGFRDPKPLIKINNKYMIEGVVENLRPKSNHKFIFICQQQHMDNYNLKDLLGNIAPNSIVIPIDNYTEGAACTVLLARKYINNDDELMIANSDQWVDISIDDYLSSIRTNNYHGQIMTMTANDPKWSYVKLDGNKNVINVVEKKVVSNEATVGIYNFKKGKDFCFAADQMIHKKLRVNNEYYVAPCYNELLELEYRVGIYNIGSDSSGMYGLGTPEDLDTFCSSSVFSRF